jgi:hypothetical protein
MSFIPRIGRPGLIGLAARTAVVAGTATAVSGGIRAHQQKKAQAEFEAAQYEAARYESVQQVSASPAPIHDLVTELQRLSDLKSQGLLSETEFEAAKAKLLQ